MRVSRMETHRSKRGIAYARLGIAEKVAITASRLLTGVFGRLMQVQFKMSG